MWISNWVRYRDIEVTRYQYADHSWGVKPGHGTAIQSQSCSSQQNYGHSMPVGLPRHQNDTVTLGTLDFSENRIELISLLYHSSTVKMPKIVVLFPQERQDIQWNVSCITCPWWGESIAFPLSRPVIQSFDVFLDVNLGRLLNKQSSCCWFEMPWHSCVTTVMSTEWHISMA